jgi:hypothetical protein
MSRDDDHTVIEPEVLPPEPEFMPPRGKRRGPDWPTLWNALVSGLLIDVVDLATLNPATPYLGLGLGALAGWYICRNLNVPKPARIWWIAGSALYCAVPRTHFFPLATILIVMRAARHIKWRNN